MSNKWTIANMPDLSSKIAIVTGANSGIGYETARALAQKGATAVMACRNMQKAEAAAAKIQSENPKGDVPVMWLDLNDLDSIRAFADAFKKEYGALHLLINNAGIMVPPFGHTKQGFETQFGVNHLGHFALTVLLLERIVATPRARVVTVSSIAHRQGKINFDDLNWEKGYHPPAAYSQSKLANLLFTYELQRKLTAAGKDTLSVAAHPGWTATNLQKNWPLFRFLNNFFAQNWRMGALPTLMAATADGVQGGNYYGPGKRFETVGYPKLVQSNDNSHDTAVAARLWDISEEMSGVTFAM